MRRKSSLYFAIILSLIFGIGLAFACQTPTEVKETRTVSSMVINFAKLSANMDIVNELRRAMPASSVNIGKGYGHVNSTPTVDIIWTMIGQVNQGRTWTDLRRLTGLDPICTSKGCHTITNRVTGSEGLQWAKDYVDEELVKQGYIVERQNWSNSGYTDQNLIVRKPGVDYPGEEVYFIAHLDGYLDNNPAADDDASGAVSLLELARMLSSRSFSHTVVLVFSTGEEQGALGSRSYVNQLTLEQLSAIKYLVSVEMLGYDSNNDGVMELWSGDQPLDFAQLLSGIISNYKLGLTPEIVTGCT